jgi:glycosyltransferase involved in cell wall biosynthesis
MPQETTINKSDELCLISNQAPSLLVSPSPFPKRVREGKRRRFRIGIWCDYGVTLTPKDGIGVFVYNLATGLLSLAESPEIVMLVRPGDQPVVEGLRKSAEGRLEIIPARPNLLSRASDQVDQITLQCIRTQDRLTLFREILRNRTKETVLRLLKRAMRGSILLAVVLAIGLPIAFAILWALYAVFQLVASLGLILRLPIKLACDEIRKIRKEKESRFRTSFDIAKAANCDVWLIPHLGLDGPLPSPSILVIHDLVPCHYPEGLSPNYVRTVNRLASKRAAEATLCACMSSFIRDTDLLGELGLPSSKVRMVRFAAPRDFPTITRARAAELRPARLKRPYLFFPGGIRGYKNQRILIEALRVLFDQHNENNIDVVFTGETPDYLPSDLRELVNQHQVSDRVHVLGPVDRESLAALYQGALAVLVPSLYEQGSFPIYEALHFECPVASSEIPSLREQCAPMGEAMLYFDPRDPNSVAQTIIKIRDHRQEIKNRQYQASRLMWQRTWQDVAREWLAVLKEAVDIKTKAGPKEAPAQAPWKFQEMTPCQNGPQLEVLLFLQTAYLGGVWEATRPLIQELVKVNKERQRLDLTLAVHADQTGLGKLEIARDDLRIEEIRMESITRLEMKDQLGIVPRWPFEAGYQFSYLRGAMPAALRADAWFALGDRFEAPLLPVRPYGLIIFDLLPTIFPNWFSPDFRRMATEGMKPAAQAARIIMVTTLQAQDDVRRVYGIESSRIRLVPRACDPEARFQKLRADPIDIPASPLILNVANANAHKGGESLVRAVAILKKKHGLHSPKLVICGHDTNKFSAKYFGLIDHPDAPAIRNLVDELGLIEGKDVAFLGFVSDEQLRFLHERCSILVNAALYDDGSFSMIEGAYFGQRVISSQYRAAEFLCERFEVPAKFFPPGNAPALADLLEQCKTENRISGVALEQVRAKLASPELGYHRYAERVYDILVELAELGRRERNTAETIRPAA